MGLRFGDARVFQAEDVAELVDKNCTEAWCSIIHARRSGAPVDIDAVELDVRFVDGPIVFRIDVGDSMAALCIAADLVPPLS